MTWDRQEPRAMQGALSMQCPAMSLRLGALVASAQALRLQAGPGDRDTDFSGICAGGGFHTVSTLAVKQRRHATLL